MRIEPRPDKEEIARIRDGFSGIPEIKTLLAEIDALRAELLVARASVRPLGAPHSPVEWRDREKR